MDSSGLKNLYIRFLANECSPEEIKLLLHHFEMEEDEVELKAVIRQYLAADLPAEEHFKNDWQPVLQETYHSISQKTQLAERGPDNERKTRPSVYKSKRWLYVAAAVFVLCLATSAWIWLNGGQAATTSPSVAVQRQDLSPGGNKAILTLANGSTIALNTIQQGKVTVQGGVQVVKLNNGRLAYNKATSTLTDQQELFYNTISTPRGGQYEVVLSDGTKVWLNAQSSIRFPSAFKGNIREVEVSGEAYFEVEENSRKPFRVIANNLTVEVLGTHFNMMAYKNEPVSTVTLLEGAVKVKTGRQHMTLAPGQQAQLNGQGQLRKNEQADLQGILAWKNNQFWFNDDDIQTVMRKIERWYDIDVVIKGNIPQHFVGTIPRNINISKVFHVLQATSHIQYTIEDNKLIVSPYRSMSPVYKAGVPAKKNTQ